MLKSSSNKVACEVKALGTIFKSYGQALKVKVCYLSYFQKEVKFKIKYFDIYDRRSSRKYT